MSSRAISHQCLFHVTLPVNWYLTGSAASSWDELLELVEKLLDELDMLLLLHWEPSSEDGGGGWVM